MELNDQLLNQLYERIQHNDSKAFESLYYLMYKRLYGVADMILEYRELNEEVLEEVFTSLWLNRHKIKVKNLFTYLYVLTKNKAIDVKRKEEKWSFFTLEDVHEDLLTTTLTPESNLVSREEQRYIYSLITKLPERRKHVLILAKYHGLRLKEVAEILGISVKTVENHLAAALKDIQEALIQADIPPLKRRRLMNWLL